MAKAKKKSSRVKVIGGSKPKTKPKTKAKLEAKAKKKPKSKAKPKVKGKKKDKKKSMKLKVINGKSGSKKTLEVTGKCKKKKIKVIDNTPGSKDYEKTKKEFHSLREQIAQANKDIGAKFFELGAALKVVRDRELWKYEKGYRSFTEFVDRDKSCEGITRQTAYNMMAVATNLKREQAIKFGPSVSYVISQATDEKCMKTLTHMASKGASAKKLKEVAKQQRKAKGVVSRSPGRKKKKKTIIKRGVKVTTAGGEVEDVEITPEALHQSKKKRRKTEYSFIGDKAVIGLKKVSDKKKVKAGWLRCQFQLGNDGPIVKIQVNHKRKLLKYRIHSA